MTATAERLGGLVAPVAEELGLIVYDIEDASGTLRVLLDRAGGIDVDELSEASRRISRSMDLDGSFGSTTTLEVSSPGLERHLRTPVHFAGAIGERVKVKLRPGVVGDRRIDGVLTAADEITVTITPEVAEARTLPITDVASARTVFVWGPGPDDGASSRRRPHSGASDRAERPDRTASTDVTDEAAIDETEATP